MVDLTHDDLMHEEEAGPEIYDLDDLCDLAAERTPLLLWFARRAMRKNAVMRTKFYKDLAAQRALDKEIPQALATIYANVTDEGRNVMARISPTAIMCTDWIRRTIEAGESDGEVAHDWLPHNEAQLIDSYSEQELPPAPLREMAAEVLQMARWYAKIKRALRMPLAMTVGTIGVLLWLTVVKIPVLLKQSGGRFHLSGGLATTESVSNGIVAYWLPVSIAAVAVVVLFFYSLNNWSHRLGGLRQVLDDWPPYSFHRTTTALQFLDQLGSQMVAGRDQTTALSALEETATPYVAGHIEAIKELPGLSVPEALYQLDRNWPPRALVRTLRTTSVGTNPGQAIKDAVASEKEKMQEALDEFIGLLDIIMPFVSFGLTLLLMELSFSIPSSLGIMR